MWASGTCLKNDMSISSVASSNICFLLDYHWMDGERGLVARRHDRPDQQAVQHINRDLHSGGCWILSHLCLRTVTRLSSIL